MTNDGELAHWHHHEDATPNGELIQEVDSEKGEKKCQIRELYQNDKNDKNDKNESKVEKTKFLLFWSNLAEVLVLDLSLDIIDEMLLIWRKSLLALGELELE